MSHPAVTMESMLAHDQHTSPGPGPVASAIARTRSLPRTLKSLVLRWYFCDRGLRGAVSKTAVLGSVVWFLLSAVTMIGLILAPSDSFRDAPVLPASLWRWAMAVILPALLAVYFLGVTIVCTIPAVAAHQLRKHWHDRYPGPATAATAAIWFAVPVLALSAIDGRAGAVEIRTIVSSAFVPACLFGLAEVRRPLARYLIGSPLLVTALASFSSPRIEAIRVPYLVVGMVGFLAAARQMLAWAEEKRSSAEAPESGNPTTIQAARWTGAGGLTALIAVGSLTPRLAELRLIGLPIAALVAILANITVARVQRVDGLWPDWAVRFYSYADMDGGMRSLRFLLVGLLASLILGVATSWAAPATAFALFTAVGLHLVENRRSGH